jgi:hypothetical protein
MSARYSQNDEQDVILEYFNGSIGRFLDIGAFDGITLSSLGFTVHYETNENVIAKRL